MIADLGGFVKNFTIFVLFVCFAPLFPFAIQGKLLNTKGGFHDISGVQDKKIPIWGNFIQQKPQYSVQNLHFHAPQMSYDEDLPHMEEAPYNAHA